MVTLRLLEKIRHLDPPLYRKIKLWSMDRGGDLSIDYSPSEIETVLAIAKSLELPELRILARILNQTANRDGSCFPAIMSINKYITIWRESPRTPRQGVRLYKRYPDWWRLFSFTLPRQTREKIFEPAFNEMLRDYALARRRFQDRPRTLNFVFGVKSIVTVCQCWRSMVGTWTFRVALGVPFVKYIIQHFRS